MAIKRIEAQTIVLENLAWLLYGPPGGGKTYLAGTFPRPMVVISSTREKGHVTLRGLSHATVLLVDTVKDFEEAVRMAITEQPTRRYKTIVVDGITSFVEMYYAETKAQNANPKNPNGYVAQDDWLDWGTQFIDLLARLRAHPWEVVWTANIQAVESKYAPGELRAGPASFRWLAERLPAKFDNTIYVESSTDGVGVPSFRAYPSGLGNIFGRMRGIQPGAVVESPTWRKLTALAEKPLFAAPTHKPAEMDPPSSSTEKSATGGEEK